MTRGKSGRRYSTSTPGPIDYPTGTAHPPKGGVNFTKQAKKARMLALLDEIEERIGPMRNHIMGELDELRALIDPDGAR